MASQASGDKFPQIIPGGALLGPTALGTPVERTTSPRLVEPPLGNQFPAGRPRGKGYELHREQPATEPACRAKPLPVGFDISGLAWAPHALGLKDSSCAWAETSH